MMKGMQEEAKQILHELIEGNERFRSGKSIGYNYSLEDIVELADSPKPRAAILACSDGRVAPEVIFNQPLGKLFVSRVPGNVASDSAKWMLEIAVSNLSVPLVIVMGHTQCLAVKQVVEGAITGSGGGLRYAVSTAVMRARARGPEDLFLESVMENARLSTEDLVAESWAVKRALEEGRTSIATGYYDVHSGRFNLI